MMSHSATNPRYPHILAEVPEEVRATFSEAQLAALARSSRMQATRHIVDYRVSVPSPFGKRYYVALLVGRERRNIERLQREGQSETMRIAVLFSVLTAISAGLLLFGMFCTVYLIKSYSGINLFDGESPLHPLYLLLRQ